MLPPILPLISQGGAKIIWIRGDMRELDYTQFDENTERYQQVKQEHEMQTNVLKCFDSIVVISDVVQQTLTELFGITKNVVKVSNSIDSEKVKLLSEEPIPLPDKMLFTTLGRLDYNKNQILLLKAIKELKQHRDDFIVYLLGDGEDRGKLEQYIKNSVATILTSLSEGFSLVLTESAMLNTPIISTDVGIARELVEKPQHEILEDSMYILRVLKDDVPYEYLINRKRDMDKLIVFHNGAVAGGNVNVAIFQRHS